MAEFSKLVITNKGQTLIVKTIAGEGNIEFTKISTSATQYQLSQLEALTSLTNVKQTSLISKITRTNDVAVKVEAAFSNADLTDGYYMRTLGLYAVDPDDGEILYAVTVESSGSCYMPPYNGVTVSGAYVQLVTTVGNADNVSLDVSQAAVATIGDVQALQNQIRDLQEHQSPIGIPYGDNIPTEDRTAGVFYLQQTEEEGIPGAALPVETNLEVIRPAAAPLQSAKILGETTETGTGDKSPQNPYTIVGAEPTKLRVCGKNLIPTPANGQSSGGVTFTVNEDGSITVQGTAPTSGHVYFNLPKFFLKQGQYCLSAGTNMPSGVELVLRKGTAIEVICQVSAEQSSVTKNITYTGEVMPYIVVFQGNTVDTTIYPQLELGSTASAYEPYQGTDTELPSLSPLYSLPDGTADSYDAVSGKEVRRVKCITFDGGEDWIKSTQTENRFLLEDGDWKANQNPICSHYPSGANTGVWIDSYNGGRLIIDVPAEQGITDLASWGYFLSDQYQEGTPVTVVYELSEPEKTVHMPEEIPVTEDTRLIAADAGGMQAVYLQVPEGEAYHTQLQDADGNVLCPATDADSVFGLAKVAKTGKYSDLTGAPAEIPFETGSFSMSPMPGACYYQRVGNFCFLSCPSTNFNGSGNGAGGGLPYPAAGQAMCILCPASYSADFKGTLKVSGSNLSYNTNGGGGFSGGFTGLYQIAE